MHSQITVLAYSISLYRITSSHYLPSPFPRPTLPTHPPGYAANFILSVFDRDWRPDMTEAEGMDVIKKCIHELHTRFLISQPNFVIKIVDQTGTRVVKL